MFDTSPSIWLLERSIVTMFEVQFQNKPKALLEIFDLDGCKFVTDLCVCSHVGKLGPILQELIVIDVS